MIRKRVARPHPRDSLFLIGKKYMKLSNNVKSTGDQRPGLAVLRPKRALALFRRFGLPDAPSRQKSGGKPPHFR
jgi:hypothetical protein